MESFDCTVVGGGWYGLAAAKVYLELHQDAKVLLLEASGSCGGTWAKDRIYPGLKSNNLHGTYEYPDFPMHPETYGVQPGQHIPGGVLHKYLTDFARHFGVLERIRFFTRVESISPSEKDTWTVSTASTNGSQETGSIHTKKLILATGLTSTPNLPVYPGKEDFKGPYFHAKDFHINGESIKTSKYVVVVGGAKSAFDVAHSYADAGAQVDLIIRPTGKGPVWLAYPYVDFGLRLEKLLHVRALTCFSPCPWGSVGGYGIFRRFLHGTVIGRWIVDAFWRSLGGSVIAQNGYASHPELQKLQPWDSAFWIGSGLSIHNYDSSFFEMVKKGQVRVHVAEIDHLTEDAVYLNGGERINADTVVCATGWKKEPSIKFIGFPEINIGLGRTPEEQKALNDKADADIWTMFPRLRNQPLSRAKPKTSDPYRLYRFIVPPMMMEKRNLAFAGMVSSISTSISASTQALWISAFFDGKLDHLAETDDAVTSEVMRHTQWGKWRYPGGYGADLPDFAFDALPYIDLLNSDLGVKVNRKSNAIAELFAPYGPEDYVGVVDEWKASHDISSKSANGHVY